MECRILCIFENRSHSILKLMHWIAVVQIVPTSIEVDDSACSDDLVTGQEEAMMCCLPEEIVDTFGDRGDVRTLKNLAGVPNV